MSSSLAVTVSNRTSNPAFFASRHTGKELSMVRVKDKIRGMKRKFLSTYEASRKYKLSTSYLRHLLLKGTLKADQAILSPGRSIWLIDEPSLKAFVKTKRIRGPKPKRKKRT